MALNKFDISLIIFLLFFMHCNAQESDTLCIDFNKLTPGAIKTDQLREHVGAQWVIGGERASVIKDESSQHVLRVAYPKGAVGPENGGVQFLNQLAPSDEYYLDYYVKFEEGFDFRLGGKLPGLTSGGTTYTGGNHPNNGEGWSTRYMWVKDGEIVVYFYYLDMKHEYGDPVKLNVSFQPGTWYRLTQRIKLNTDNLKNGELQVWVDGTLILTKENIRFRLWNKGMIDTFYFSTFHGGATDDWAPLNDSYIRFKNIVVSSFIPDFTTLDTVNKPE